MSERTDQKLEQLGWGCLLLQPIALAYGRRGVYLFSTLLNVPIMIWTANSSSPGEWYAHRIIIGIVNAPIESLPEISVADLMFAHERGTWMAAYVLVLFESNFIAPLIAGWLNDAIGWRWTMKFGAIVAAVSFLILFFFMEETMYFRHTTEGEQPATHRGEVTDVNTAPPSPEKPQVPTAVCGLSLVRQQNNAFQKAFWSPFGQADVLHDDSTLAHNHQVPQRGLGWIYLRDQPQLVPGPERHRKPRSKCAAIRMEICFHRLHLRRTHGWCSIRMPLGGYRSRQTCSLSGKAQWRCSRAGTSTLAFGYRRHLHCSWADYMGERKAK
jgi:hypothetical protein